MNSYKLVVALVGSVITLVTFFIWSSQDEIVFTNKEKAFIQESVDTIFYVGYYPTKAEEQFSQKLCEKIEEDTSLKLRLYDASWSDTLEQLKNGELPIVMNINKTSERQVYANFTASFKPISSGIYSKKENPITSFEDLEGKTLGIEKDVALLNSFTKDYPYLDYELHIFEAFIDTREAFEQGDIDGFLATKSFDEHVKELYFYEIESISKNTNHIGVGKDYPELYSILNKEVESLKKQNWDTTASQVINFELQKSLVDFNLEEQEYLNNLESITIGIPSEFFLYMEGEDYQLEGALPELMNKIAFVSNSEIYYEVDRLVNLKLRKDIDYYVDNTETTPLESYPLFSDKIIIVSDNEHKVIHEVYELSNYQVGVIGVPNTVEALKREMPNMDIVEYMDIKQGAKDINRGQLDYIIVPYLYFTNASESVKLIERGNYKTSTLQLLGTEKEFLNIVDKSLDYIDAEQLLENEMREDAAVEVKGFFLVLAVLVVVGIAMYYGHKKYRVLKYKDNDYGLHNLRYLETQLNKEEYYFIRIHLIDYSLMFHHYGKKFTDKYIRYFIEHIKKTLQPKETLIYLSKSELLVVKKVQEGLPDFQALCLTHKEIRINKIPVEYKCHVTYCNYYPLDKITTLLNKLELGDPLTYKEAKIVSIDKESYKRYKNKIGKKISLKTKIYNGDVTLKTRKVVNRNNEEAFTFIHVEVEGLEQESLLKHIQDDHLLKKLDKRVFTLLFHQEIYNGKRILLKVSEGTLKSDGFFQWVSHKAQEHKMTIFFLIEFDLYEKYGDDIRQVENIHVVLHHFGNNIRNEYLAAFYDVEYMMFSDYLLKDYETYEELINMMHLFSLKYKKKSISEFKDYKDADYYVVSEEG